MNPEENKPSTTPELSPTQLLSTSVDSYKARFLVMFGISLVPLAVAVVIQFLMAGVLINTLPEETISSVAIVAGITLGVISGVFQLWSQIALIYVIKDPVLGIVEAFKTSVVKLRSYIWVSLLTGIIVFGGALFLVIPGILFSLWYGLGVFVLVNEELTGMQVLQKSKELVVGSVGWILWRFLVIAGVLLLAYAPLGIIAGFIDSGIGEDVTVAADLLGGVFSLLVSPLILIAFYKMYECISYRLNFLKYVAKLWPWSFW